VITEQRNGGLGDHLVHFYSADDELADRAGAYLTEALEAGGVAIAIASEPHLLAIGETLAAAGVDTEAAREDERLILLDARATLEKLVVEGQVDREAFDREVGSRVRAAVQRHPVVRAYGEMVDLLWQDGDIPEAIELEAVWNELMAKVPFTLLCAYRSEAVEGPDHEDALRVVCQLHSSHETSRAFEAELTSPGAARLFVKEALRHWGQEESVIEDARLLISELAANAVIHTQSPFSVSIASEPSRLRLAVHDRSNAVPTTIGRSEDAPAGGRGLQIVAAVADDWGVVTNPLGKTVWAELTAANTHGA
jgi:anti-sigma regulatory factor (Ser/Thr protein kinase)